MKEKIKKDFSATLPEQIGPANLQWRPSVTGDAPALASLCSSSLNSQSFAENCTPEELQKALSSPDMLATVGGWHREELTVHASLYSRGCTDSACELSLEVTVSPAWQIPSVNLYLQQWFLTATENLSLKYFFGVRLKIYTLLPESGLWVRALVTQLKFKAGHLFTDMRLSLANYSEDVPQEHLCNIIAYSEAFSDATRLACNEAFSDHWGTRPWSAQSWQDDVTDVPEFLPELSFLLVSPETSEVIAFVLCSLTGGNTEVHCRPKCYIDLAGTLPALRGKGLATALLIHTLNTAAGQGYDEAALMVDSDGGYDALRLYR